MEQNDRFFFRISARRQQVVEDAINSVIGHDWSLRDLKGRIELLVFPDETELIKLDGKDLIRFAKPELTTRRRGMTDKQYYKELAAIKKLKARMGNKKISSKDLDNQIQREKGEIGTSGFYWKDSKKNTN